MKTKTAKEILIENLRELMRVTETTRNALVERSGVSERMVGFILSGDRTPTVVISEKLAKAFGLEGWQLLIPNLSSELGRMGKLSLLVKNYGTASEKGREYIDRVAEQEARYGKSK